MRYKILTVDDSKTVRIIVKKAFKSFDCDILEAANGVEYANAVEQLFGIGAGATIDGGQVRLPTGLGLGLSIVNELLTLHNARFGVKSSLGKGTTFWFELDAVRRH